MKVTKAQHAPVPVALSFDARYPIESAQHCCWQRAVRWSVVESQLPTTPCAFWLHPAVPLARPRGALDSR